MEEELQQLRTNASGELMSDEDFIKTIESMSVEAQEREINDLLKAMHENRIVSWDEAERILQETDKTPIKCSLPEQTRPTEPDNECDVDVCIRKLLDNDPTLKEVNLNNMKRTPIPAIKRLLEALAYNEHCERVSLANMGLYDHDIMVLVTVIEMNQAIKKVNLETNYLSGEFFAKLFKAALANQTVEEVKAVNQGVSFSTQSEKEIIDAIVKNTGLTKISINFRLPEGRHKVENATLRNGEYKRIKRREAALKAKQEAEELAKNPVPKLTPEIKKEVPKPAEVAKIQKPPIVPIESKPSTATIIKDPIKPGTLTKQLSYQRASRESEEETEEVAGDKTIIPKKLQIPKTFEKLEEKKEEKQLEKVAKRPTKEWVPKKVDGDEMEATQNAPPSKSEKKLWEGPKTTKPIDQGYAPIIDLSGGGGGKSEELPTVRVPLRTRGPPVTAKNIWEQRLAKMEKKEEKKKERPLMSIKKIREMEKMEENKDKLDELLKKEPKKLNGNAKSMFESDKPTTVEKHSTQKIIAKKPNSLMNQPVKITTKSEEVEEKRPTTVIRRTVIRKKVDPIDNKAADTNEKKVRRVVRKKGPVQQQTPIPPVH